MACIISLSNMAVANLSLSADWWANALVANKNFKIPKLNDSEEYKALQLNVQFNKFVVCAKSLFHNQENSQQISPFCTHDRSS